MHFLVGIVAAVACGLAPWAAAKIPTRWIVIAAVPFLVVIAAGAALSLSLYPYTNVIVGAFSLVAGVALGRIMPPRFRPFVVLLLVLSLLDVAQMIAFLPWFRGTRHIWINIQFRLPDGHYNFALAVLIVIVAATENLRRRNATLGLSLLPGVIGMSLHEALLVSLPPDAPDVVFYVALSTILLVTGGYLLTELAVSQQRSVDSG